MPRLNRPSGRMRPFRLIVGCLGLIGWIGPHRAATHAESQNPATTARSASERPRPRPPAGRPQHTSTKDWVDAGMGRNHPAFKELEGGYLPAHVGIARVAPSTGITARVQRILFEERRARIAKSGRPRPSDAEVREQVAREDASVKQLNQALKRSRDRLRQLHDANDEERMLALERELLEEHLRRQPPAGER
jgi:hypothetical protein